MGNGCSNDPNGNIAGLGYSCTAFAAKHGCEADMRAATATEGVAASAWLYTPGGSSDTWYLTEALYAGSDSKVKNWCSDACNHSCGPNFGGGGGNTNTGGNTAPDPAVSTTAGGGGDLRGWDGGFFRDGDDDCGGWEVPVCADSYSGFTAGYCVNGAKAGYCAKGYNNNNDPVGFQEECRKTCRRCLTACHDFGTCAANAKNTAQYDCKAHNGLSGAPSWYLAQSTPDASKTNIRADCPLSCQTCACGCGDTDDTGNFGGANGVCEHCKDSDTYLDLTYGDCEGAFLSGRCWDSDSNVRAEMKTNCPYACGHCPGLDQHSSCAQMRASWSGGGNACDDSTFQEECAWTCYYAIHADTAVPMWYTTEMTNGVRH